jgi:hypothetical protein
MSVKIFEISVPEYNLSKKPNYTKIGEKVDEFVVKIFPKGKYIVRAIGHQDHPNMSLNELVSVIKKLGTDKYNPDKIGVAHKEFSDYDYELQAGEIEIKGSTILHDDDVDYDSFFAEIIYNFFENAPYDRGYAVRIDLLVFYDPKKVVRAQKIASKNKQIEGLDKFLYKFKYPNNKKDALIGIVKISR